SPRTLLALAGSYEQMRDYSSAAEVLRRALALNPDNGRLKRALAQNLLFAEKLDESLKIYQELAAEDPKDMQAPLRMAEIYRQKRNIAQAGAALAKAREIDRSALEVRYEEVNLLEAEGKSEEAAAVLKALVTDTAKKTYAPPERNTRAMLLERLGALYRSVHQPEQSLEAFRQIAELDPEYGPRVALHTIDVWRGERDFAKAREEAEAAVKRYPEDRLVRLSHASLLADLGKVDQAAGEVRSLLKGGKERETYLALAQIYEKGKRFADMEKAIAEAERLSGARQEKEAVHFMRGAMYEKMKKYDLAEAEFGKVLELNPENAGAMNYLGYMLADRGLRLAESEKLISGALQIEPFNGAFLDSLGWAYYRQNRLAEAEAALLRAIERVRRDPTIHDHLGDVYLKQGRIREAMAQWQISLKEWESSPQADQDPEEMAKVSKKLESGRVRLAREHSKTQP
ncbi:MAG: tetratricopeptide repeat protein, partial [Acidobacteria bacterium]|nr:tetratricopeptide repeat protein [Acidobacteriota bacterium]